MRKIILAIIILALGSGTLNAARLSMFVNIVHPPPAGISFKVKTLSLLTGQGDKIHMPLANPVVTTKTSFGQSYLSGSEVPKGKYTAITLEIEQARMETSDFQNARGLNIKIPTALEIKEEESLCLFLNWDVQASLKGNMFHPSFFATPQSRPLRGETLYVTCDNIKTLFAIRTDTNRVVASLATKEGPKELAVFPMGDRLYVLCEQSRSLISIELSTFRIIDSLLLPMVLRPRFLTLVDGKTAVITDPSNDQIILVDVSSGSLLRYRRLGYRLSEVACRKDKEQIFVSSSGEQKVYQLNMDLSTAREFATGSSPRGLWIQGPWLYVADSGSGTVSVFNLNTGRLLGRIRSGRDPVRIIGTQRRLYISNRKSGSLSILWPGQMSISKKIKVGQTPSAMAVCERRRWIYVVDRASKNLVVVNSASLKKAGTIDMGSPPYGLAIAR